MKDPKNTPTLNIIFHSIDDPNGDNPDLLSVEFSTIEEAHAAYSSIPAGNQIILMFVTYHGRVIESKPFEPDDVEWAVKKLREVIG